MNVQQCYGEKLSRYDLLLAVKDPGRSLKDFHPGIPTADYIIYMFTSSVSSTEQPASSKV